MMELTLIKTKENKGTKYELYTIGRYEVQVSTFANGGRYIATRVERDTYLPEIYCRDDFEGNIHGFTIQTTSYGALNADEIQKVIAGLNEAVEVVEILTKEFVK